MDFVFLSIYLGLFVLYASFYSSRMQDINEKNRKLKIQGIDKDKINSAIDVLLIKVKKLNRIILVLSVLTLLTHLILIKLKKYPSVDDYKYSIILFVPYLILIIITKWMKGAGSLNQNPTTGRTRSPWL